MPRRAAAWLLPLLLLLQQLSAAVALDSNPPGLPNDPSYVSPSSAAARQQQQDDERARTRQENEGAHACAHVAARAGISLVTEACMQCC